MNDITCTVGFPEYAVTIATKELVEITDDRNNSENKRIHMVEYINC